MSDKYVSTIKILKLWVKTKVHVEFQSNWLRIRAAVAAGITENLLPYANAVVQHHQAGFQTGKSTTNQHYTLRQILEKDNEYNIQTHHLFTVYKRGAQATQIEEERVQPT
jgi:hypothetical protein